MEHKLTHTDMALVKVAAVLAALDLIAIAILVVGS
ncbi:hypothetical protein ISF9_097 [Microbacterium phage vB_MoxS-ISF9]|uniref:Uncharacterized protein n=1 Tax=Microbacterium phage vB_MoxS-ISF9 TaxID=1458670 RepID=W8P0D0_9CAUD|nr:hypothetical protein ISF9_097 [Microbacterium phage vB_MoxS-ISF9]AHL18567.1 hypothetical protein ISF9_097 [Microbacterium phage vB_MoxS-ISF9]